MEMYININGKTVQTCREWQCLILRHFICLEYNFPTSSRSLRYPRAATFNLLFVRMPCMDCTVKQIITHPHIYMPTTTVMHIQMTPTLTPPPLPHPDTLPCTSTNHPTTTHPTPMHARAHTHTHTHTYICTRTHIHTPTPTSTQLNTTHTHFKLAPTPHSLQHH